MEQPDRQSPPSKRRRTSSESDHRSTNAWLPALVATLVLGLICLWGLSRPGVPYQTEPLDGWSIDDPNFLGLGTRVRGVELATTPLPDGRWSHEIGLLEIAPLSWSKMRSVSFRFDVRTPLGQEDNDRSRTRVSSAEITSGDNANGAVRLTTSGRSTLSNEGRLELFPAPGVDMSREHSTNWTLKVTTSSRVRLFLRSNVSEPGRLTEPRPRGGHFSIALQNPKGPSFAFPLGDFTLTQTEPPVSRARLLTYLWQWHEIDSLAAWLAMGCLVFGAGAALFPWVGGEHFNRILFSLRAGAASGLMFLGLGLLQTIVTPPFFGTDEPAHIFSYHLWMTDLDAVEKTWVLGERNHAIRMMWRPAQKFTAANIDHPLDRFIDSPSTMYTRPGGRSATALRAWRAFRRFVTGHDPAEMILRLRLLSLAGAALCLAAGVAAMAATSTPVTPSAWLGWGLLLTPSLPYYAMNVSNYSWVLGGAFLLGAGISVLINQAETPWWSGMVIGLGASFSFFSSISGWPLAAVVLCSLAGVSLRRLIIDPGAKRRPSMRFWITTAAGLSPFGILSESQFAAEQSKYGQVALRHFGISHVPSYLALVWTVCGLLALLEWICAWLASESTAAFGARVARRAGILSWAILALVVVNLFIPVRQLEALPEAVPHWEFHLGQARAALPADADFAKPPLPSPARYALHAVRAVVSSLGFGRHDYLTEKLFWLAIGSIETSAPDWMFSVLSLFIAIGLVLLFWRIGATENGPRLILVLATLAGLIASLMLTAMGSILSPATPTLHGRYLMGFHVALLLLATVGFKGPVLRLQWRAPNLFAWLCLGSVILIHGSCLQLEWSRYF